MEISAKIDGLEDAMRTLRNAFPEDTKTQRKVLNQTMSQAAGPTIMKLAKQFADDGASGALAESIKPRALSEGKARSRGAVASVEITPVRDNLNAINLYYNYYYTSRGRSVSHNNLVEGIRHGHLVEFGHATLNGGYVAAKPFLWPAAVAGKTFYFKVFSKIMKRKIELNIRRIRRRAAKR